MVTVIWILFLISLCFLMVGYVRNSSWNNNTFSIWRWKRKRRRHIEKENMYLYGNKEGRETHEDYVKTFDVPIVIDGVISKEFKLNVGYYDMTLGLRTSASEVHVLIIRNGKTVHRYFTTYETFKIYPTIPKLVNSKEPFVYEEPLLYHITNNSRPEEVVNGILKEQLRYKNKREEMFSL